MIGQMPGASIGVAEFPSLDPRENGGHSHGGPLEGAYCSNTRLFLSSYYLYSSGCRDCSTSFQGGTDDQLLGNISMSFAGVDSKIPFLEIQIY